MSLYKMEDSTDPNAPRAVLLRGPGINLGTLPDAENRVDPDPGPEVINFFHAA